MVANLEGLALAFVILLGASVLGTGAYRWGRADGVALQTRCAASCDGAGAWERTAGLCRCERPAPGLIPCDLMASGVCFGDPDRAVWAGTSPPPPEIVEIR